MYMYEGHYDCVLGLLYVTHSVLSAWGNYYVIGNNKLSSLTNKGLRCLTNWTITGNPRRSWLPQPCSDRAHAVELVHANGRQVGLTKGLASRCMLNLHWQNDSIILCIQGILNKPHQYSPSQLVNTTELSWFTIVTTTSIHCNQIYQTWDKVSFALPTTQPAATPQPVHNTYILYNSGLCKVGSK